MTRPRERDRGGGRVPRSSACYCNCVRLWSQQLRHSSHAHECKLHWVFLLSLFCFVFIAFAGTKAACAPVPAAAVFISSHHTLSGTTNILGPLKAADLSVRSAYKPSALAPLLGLGPGFILFLPHLYRRHIPDPIIALPVPWSLLAAFPQVAWVLVGPKSGHLVQRGCSLLLP